MSKRIEDLRADEPHTLAQFIRHSQQVGIVVTGLPTGSLADAAKKFEEVGETVQLKMSISPYFYGNWYSPDWRRKVATTDGTVLFTITVDNRLESFHFKLHVEEPAIQLLQAK